MPKKSTKTRSTKTRSTKTRVDPRTLRRSLGLKQETFWAALGTTQSGGSRYETGRQMPPSVAMLLDAIYLKGIDLKQLQVRDMSILAFMKTQHPDLYKSLDKAASCKPSSHQEKS